MPTDAIREALGARRWTPTTPFSARLFVLRRLLQENCDRLPADEEFVARVPIIIRRLTLGDLALLLPPSELRLLGHVRARRPLRYLVGTCGFRSVSRVNHRLQRLLARVHAYCGSAVRHSLMQPYDRPGHDHRRRPGRPRRLRPSDRFLELRVWVPRRFAMANGFPVRETEGARTREERRRAARRFLQCQLPPIGAPSLGGLERGRDRLSAAIPLPAQGVLHHGGGYELDHVTTPRP